MNDAHFIVFDEQKRPRAFITNQQIMALALMNNADAMPWPKAARHTVLPIFAGDIKGRHHITQLVIFLEL